MISRDYTQEIGIASARKMISRPLAFIVLALVAIAVAFGVAAVLRATKAHHADAQSSSVPARQ